MGLAANTMYFTEIVPKGYSRAVRGFGRGFHSFGAGLRLRFPVGSSTACSTNGAGVKAGTSPVGGPWVFCGIIAPLVVLILLNTGFVLESPRYLLMVGREDEGKELLIRLVGREEASRGSGGLGQNEEESSATWWQVIWGPERRRRGIRICQCVVHAPSPPASLGALLLSLLPLSLSLSLSSFHSLLFLVPLFCPFILCGSQQQIAEVIASVAKIFPRFRTHTCPDCAHGEVQWTKEILSATVVRWMQRRKSGALHAEAKGRT